MTCIKCKGQMSQSQLMQMTGRFKGLDLTVEIEGRQCTQCGHQIVAGRHMSEFMQKLGDAYRVSKGLLTSAEIRRQRESLGMSQTEFADYLGVGVAGVKRWELGDIQNKAVDELIRLKTDLDYIDLFMSKITRRLASRGGSEMSIGNRASAEQLVECADLVA